MELTTYWFHTKRKRWSLVYNDRCLYVYHQPAMARNSIAWHESVATQRVYEVDATGAKQETCAIFECRGGEPVHQCPSLDIKDEFQPRFSQASEVEHD